MLLPDGQVQWQDLGEAAVIDALVDTLRTQIQKCENNQDVCQGRFEVVGKESGIKSTKQAARELD